MSLKYPAIWPDSTYRMSGQIAGYWICQKAWYPVSGNPAKSLSGVSLPRTKKMCYSLDSLNSVQQILHGIFGNIKALFNSPSFSIGNWSQLSSRMCVCVVVFKILHYIEIWKEELWSIFNRAASCAPPRFELLD